MVKCTAKDAQQRKVMVSTHRTLDVFDLDICLSGFQLALVCLLLLSFACILVHATPNK